MLGRLFCFWSVVRKSRRGYAQVRREAANAAAINAWSSPLDRDHGASIEREERTRCRAPTGVSVIEEAPKLPRP